MDNLTLNLGKELHVDCSLSGRCYSVKESNEMSEEALALDEILAIWAFFYKLSVVFVISSHDVLRLVDHLDILSSLLASMIFVGFYRFIA